MSGGYSRVRLNPFDVTGGARNAEKVLGKFDGGAETELSPLDMPLNKSPHDSGADGALRAGMHAVRIKDGYLFPDWGSEEVGTAAVDDVQALGTRQSGTGLLDDPEIFRVFFNGGAGRFQLEVLDPLAVPDPDWVAGADFPIGWAPNLNRRISHETFLDEVFFAGGTEEVAIWDGAAITTITGVTADYIAQFADRVVLLRAGGDFQRVRASVNGIFDDFTGTGSVDRILESRTTLDEVDALVALVPLTSDIAVLFRSQSIWRVNRTGNAANPLAFNQWIDGVGMPSSFGAQSVPGGIIFAGSDHYVYLLTEGGLTQLGRMYTRQDEVLNGGSEAIYIPATGEFRINWKLNDLLNQGMSTLDYLGYTRTGNPVWTFRAHSGFPDIIDMRNPTVVKPQGIGTTTDPALMYSTGASVFRFLVPGGGGITEEKVFGFWDSATLNRANRFSAYSMKRLVIRLRQFEVATGATPTVSAFVSTNGGRTFQEAQDSPKNLNRIQEFEFGLKRLAFHWDSPGAPATGYDLRFRIILNDGAFNIGFESWEADIVDRGDQFILAAGDDG